MDWAAEMDDLNDLHPGRSPGGGECLVARLAAAIALPLIVLVLIVVFS